MPADPIIAVEHLTAGYEGYVLMQDVNFSVKRGEVFIILGGSGSGKSTLLKHMIGLYQPIAGSIRIEGDDIVTAEGAERRAILNKIGVMYQSGALFGSMTLLENVRLPLEEYTALDGRGDGSDREDEAAAGRARCLLRTHAGRDQRRHAKARRDRARDGAGPDDPVPRRAVGRARPDHLGRARPADPATGEEPAHHLRRRHARARLASTRSPTG